MAAKKPAKAPVYTLGHGTPSLFNARLSASKVILLVNGPGMLYERLDLVCTLSAAEGATADAWEAIAKGLDCVAHCPVTGKETVTPAVSDSRIGLRVSIGFGSMGMYQNEVQIRSKRRGETLKGLFDRCLDQKDSSRYQVMFVPVAATGHAEHDIPNPAEDQHDHPAPPDQPDHSHHH